MTMICINCSLKALVEGTEPPVFEEEPAEHMLRCHPDPIKAQRERIELETKMRAKLEKDDGRI